VEGRSVGQLPDVTVDPTLLDQLPVEGGRSLEDRVDPADQLIEHSQRMGSATRHRLDGDSIADGTSVTMDNRPDLAQLWGCIRPSPKISPRRVYGQLRGLIEFPFAACSGLEAGYTPVH
jgi:hypothetical protein